MATACEESATARVQLSHLQQTDGIACETYEAAVNGLLEALKQDGVCIIEVDDAMSSILRKGLAAGILNFARLIFHGSNPGGRAETDGGHHALPGKEVYNVILGERYAAY